MTEQRTDVNLEFYIEQSIPQFSVKEHESQEVALSTHKLLLPSLRLSG
jgi:hypothetical protein